MTREHQGERICFKTYKVCFKTYKRVSTEKKGGAQRVKDTAMRHLQDPN